MIKKTDVVRGLVVSGEYKKALSIARGFRLGVSRENLEKMKLAYEVMVHTGFYEQLGTNTAAAIAEGIRILKELYGQGEVK